MTSVDRAGRLVLALAGDRSAPKRCLQSFVSTLEAEVLLWENGGTPVDSSVPLLVELRVVSTWNQGGTSPL